MPALGQKRPAAARFWPKVEKSEDPNGCWLWTGAKIRGGYGFFHDGTRNGVAHRWPYQQKYGPIPDGLVACHKCDVPACVNPDHIFIGTYTDNNRDMAAKGRNAMPGPGHPLWELSQAKLANPYCERGHLRLPNRRCRECDRERERERYQNDPVYRARKSQRNEASRARHQERVKARARASYLRRKAEGYYT